MTGDKTARREGCAARKMRAVFLPVLLLMTMLAHAVLGADGDFETANQLFDEGQFAAAKTQYETLVTGRAWTANLFYNLGDTEFRLGSPGRAVLNYERALALEPAHPEAAANLALLRGKTGAKIRPLLWWEMAFPSVTAHAWTVLAASASWLLLFSVVQLASSRHARRNWWLIASSAAVLCAYSGLALWRGDQERAAAIITANQAEARLAPADRAGLAESLPAGSRVRILNERGEWIYAALPGTGRGWLPRKSVERLRPASD